MSPFTRHVELALNILQYLYLAGGDRVSCEELCMALQEGRPYCFQVLLRLRNKKYIVARRGPKGGYKMAPNTPLVSLSQFLEDFGRGFATSGALDRSLASERMAACLEQYSDYVPLEQLFNAAEEIAEERV